MKPQQIVSKLTAHIADLKAKQVAALAASEAEGVSADDRAKHLADFDQLQKDKEAAQANLGRAQAMVREEEQAAREAAVTPEREPIVMKPFVPAAQAPDFSAGKPRIPANVRRGGALKAFKGEDAEFRAYQTGLWVAATMYGHKPSLERLAEFGDALKPQATLSTTSNSGAGYFVPDVMTTAIIELQEEYGVIRRFADIEQMSSETWKGPRWSTGMVAYWVSQGNAPTQSEPGWDQVELVAKDLAAFGKMSAQLNEDALISVGDKWAMAAAVAFSFAEDNAAFNGTGTSAFGGITGLLPKVALAANVASVVTATGQTTPGALTFPSFNNVVGKFPSYPGAQPRWFCHKEVWAGSMLNLQMAAGGLTPADIRDGSSPQFLGYPVQFVNVMPKLAAATTGTIPILFADLALSTKFGDRRQRMMRVGEINDDMIKQLLTVFAASRLDINTHTVVDPKDANAAGPVCALKLG